MKIEEDTKLGFDNVLIKPKKSYLNSRNDVTLMCEYEFKYSKQKWSGIPLMAANMDTTGTIEMANKLAQLNCLTALHKYYNATDYLKLININNTILSIGEDLPNNLSDIVNTYNFTFILIDVANAYRQKTVNSVMELRKMFRNKTIIVGNVCTSDMVEELILAGADIIKCGIGPGSACTTRKIAGVGQPQLSTIIECAEVAHKFGAHIIADGGCRFAGDVVKAFGAGADFVMLGGMLAGTDESAGKLIIENEENNKNQELKENSEIKEFKYKLFYGMSSQKAQEKYSEFKDYRASEGKVAKVPYKGPVRNIIHEIFGGLRSACTYTNSQKLQELSQNTTFLKVSETTNNIYGN